MHYVWIILIALVTFGVCFVVDKSFSALFQNRDKTDRRIVRLRKRMLVFGVLVAILGLTCVVFYYGKHPVMFWSGVALMLMGGGMVYYHLSFCVHYDEEGFRYSIFGKKSRNYTYDQIRFQQLYNSQGSIVVELHMVGGDALLIQDSMEGSAAFLDYAFERWCAIKGLDKAQCGFHDPEKSCWFPQSEVL